MKKLFKFLEMKKLLNHLKISSITKNIYKIIIKNYKSTIFNKKISIKCFKTSNRLPSILN